MLQGEHVQGAVLQRSVTVTSQAWHPNKKVLAVGWESGELMVWSEQEKELYEVPSMHKAEITVLQWSSNATRLVSGDIVSIFDYIYKM